MLLFGGDPPQREVAADAAGAAAADDAPLAAPNAERPPAPADARPPPGGGEPNEAERLYGMGRKALLDQDAASAREALGACLEVAPEHVGCHWEMGWAHWLDEDYNAVIAQWERVEALDPEWEDLNKWLPKARALAGGR